MYIKPKLNYYYYPLSHLFSINSYPNNGYLSLHALLSLYDLAKSLKSILLPVSLYGMLNAKAKEICLNMISFHLISEFLAKYQLSLRLVPRHLLRYCSRAMVCFFVISHLMSFSFTILELICLRCFCSPVCLI